MLYFKHGTVEDELKRLVLEQNPKVAKLGITAENITIVNYVDYGPGIRNVEIAAAGTRGKVKVSVTLDFNWGTFGAGDFVWKVTPTMPGYKVKTSELLKVITDGLGATIDPNTFLKDPDAEIVLPETKGLVNFDIKPNLLMPYEYNSRVYVIRQKELDLGKILDGVDTSPIYFDVTKPEGAYLKLAATTEQPLELTKALYKTGSAYTEFLFWGLEFPDSFYHMSINTEVSQETLDGINEGLVNMGYTPLDRLFNSGDFARMSLPAQANGNDKYNEFVILKESNVWPKPGTSETVNSLAATQTWEYNVKSLMARDSKPCMVANIKPHQ